MVDIVDRLRDPSLGSPRWMETMSEAAQEIELLRSLLSECADDLEAEIKDRYAGTQGIYPDERRRFDRDMEPVHRARAAIIPDIPCV
jgi:hypothetical protein